MHEFSVAQQIVEKALEAAEDHDAEVVEGITLELGTATHLNPEQLEFGLEVAMEGTIADGAEVVIESVSPYGECACGWEGEPEGIDEMFSFAPDQACPECGEQVTLTRGKECRLVSITVPDEDDTEQTEAESEA